MFIYSLPIFLTSTAFVSTNAKYGIPLSRYTVFLKTVLKSTALTCCSVFLPKWESREVLRQSAVFGLCSESLFFQKTAFDILQKRFLFINRIFYGFNKMRYIY